MANDSLMEKMRARKKKIDDSRGMYWKPAIGENYVRILPSWKGPNEDFSYESPTHYRVGPNRGVVACLQQFGDVCPLCRRAEELASSTSVDDQKRANDLMPRTRILLNVLPDNDPEGTVKIWSMSPTMFSEFLSYYTNTGWGDFTDPKTGYNFTVSVKKTGVMPDGNPKLEYDFVPDRESTHIGKKMKRSDLINLEGQIAKNRKTRKEVVAIMRGEDVS